jgi:hypothetical protein
MSIIAEQQILEIVQKYGDDTPYWRFVENFKNTVGFQATGSNEDKNAALLRECARQYEYIRTAHPEYFRDLTERKGDELSVLAGIVDWAVVKNLPMMHFAGFNTSKFAASMREKNMEYAGEFPIASTDPVDAKASVASTEKLGVSEEPVVEAAPQSPSEPEPKAHSLDALIDKAVKLYQEKLGQIVRVKEYGNPSGYFSGTRETATGELYDLAVLIDTPEKELAIEEIGDDNLPYVRGTWSLKFLTGPLAEQKGFAHSHLLYADGCFGGDIMFTGNNIEDMQCADLSHQDLVALAWRDAQTLSEKQFYIKSCCGYFEDTNEQHYIQLDPPALVTGDPISIEQFRIDSDRARYQIRDFDKGNDVIDWDCDFTSDDPRLKPYRSMWAGPPSYYQNGNVNTNEVVLDYDPEHDLDKEPTIFTMR